MGATWAAITAWFLARDEAERDLPTPDRAMAALARAELARLDGDRIVGISGSVRGVARDQHGEFLAAPALARLLQHDHEHLGNGHLGSVVFDGDGPAQPVLAWLVPIVERSQTPEVVDTTLVLLGLADRHEGVAKALRDSGATDAMHEELARKGWEHRPWVPAVVGQRLVTTRVRSREAGGAAHGARDRCAAWGTERWPGHRRARLGERRGGDVWTSPAT